jgi:hypothetical protein
VELVALLMGAAGIIVILLATMLQGKIRTVVFGSIFVFGIVGGQLDSKQLDRVDAFGA